MVPLFGINIFFWIKFWMLLIVNNGAIMKSVELLLPAGNFEKMEYAFAYGADATYLGIPRFSLRARQNSFSRKDVIAAIDYARQLGKKVYVTANIFPHNRKVQPFIDYIDEFLQDCQPDAWIMSDPGMIMAMREKHPQQAIHLSVQANTVNYMTVKFWEKIGVQRIILSRELSIDEISEIRYHCPDIELEAFVHGSICIAYSGRCLLSNYFASRDPNQGTCPNSCRWKYRIFGRDMIQPDWLKSTTENNRLTQHGNEYTDLYGEYYLEESQRPGELLPIDEDENGTYIMNSRDLCAIEYLDELYRAGVNSFKVEGRTKSVYYVVSITRAYRKAVDDMLAGKPFDRKYLRDIFATANKGFISGFLKGNPGRSAQKYDSDAAEYSCYRFSGIALDYDDQHKLLKVVPKNQIWKNMNIELVTPHQIIPHRISKVFDMEQEPVDVVHPGTEFCWIDHPENPGDYVLLREKIDEFIPEQVRVSRTV
ncbi:U32 family peptidase [candidate division KSB1 bacterium]|nr:U32 family peptidase [candidate division KSB1 bacterium]